MFQDSPIDILAGADLEAYRRVRFNGTNWVYCAAGEACEAVTCARIASGDRGAAWTRNHDGAIPILVTGSTITAGTEMYGAASGQCSSTNGGEYLGKCVRLNSGAGLAGDYADIVLVRSGKALAVTASAAALALTAEQSGQVFTNTGAVGALNFVLPTAKPGLEFTFVVGAAQSLTIQTFAASGDKVCLPDTGVPGAANKGLVNAGTLDVALKLLCAVTGIWSFVGGNAKVGIWTAEP